MPPDDFPRRRAVTRGFRLGHPRDVSIGPDGTRLMFVRSQGPTDPRNCLWVAELLEDRWTERLAVDPAALAGEGDGELPPEERAKRERLREVSGGITAYTVDEQLTKAAFVLSGALWLYDLGTGATAPLGPRSGFTNPTMDPTGRRVAVTLGATVVIVDTADGTVRPLLASDSPTVSWGSAEFVAAEEMGRFSGLWWAPDGESLLATCVEDAPVARWWIADPAHPARKPTPQRYPAAGTANAEVSLHVVALDGSTTRVQWDSTEYEYLTAVSWHDGDPLVAVQNRAQTEVLVLSADPASGSTTVVAREADEQWVELVDGLPRRTPGGVLVARADPTADARRLLVLGEGGSVVAQTPDALQLRSVRSHDDDGVVFTACERDPSTEDLWRLAWDGTVTRLSEPGGYAGGRARGGTVVVARAAADELGARLTVQRAGVTSWTVPSLAETPALTVRPDFLADDTGWRHIAVLWPTDPHPEPLPVLMSPYGGPHSQRSIQAAGSFATEQWVADQGFCVVVADGPGSPSRPSNEYALYRDLTSGPLQGQVSALAEVVRRYGDRIDPSRVGIRGWSFGGFLAALAVLERPDLFHAAVAGAPVTDWALYDTHYTERYLGQPDTDAEAYARSSLLSRAAKLRRPLLLVHGLADDNVVAAHTLQLSTALLAAGREHSVLPLSGVTHMTPQEAVAENLPRMELAFLQQHLCAAPEPVGP